MLRKYKWQRRKHDQFVTVLHSKQAIIPTEKAPISTYRQGEYEIRVFSAGYAEGVLPRAGKARMPEMEV